LKTIYNLTEINFDLKNVKSTLLWKVLRFHYLVAQFLQYLNFAISWYTRVIFFSYFVEPVRYIDALQLVYNAHSTTTYCTLYFFSYKVTNGEWISTKNELNPTLCAAFFKIQSSRVNNTVLQRHILYSIYSPANEKYTFTDAQTRCTGDLCEWLRFLHLHLLVVYIWRENIKWNGIYYTYNHVHFCIAFSNVIRGADAVSNWM